jgi:NDP-4-keto-2,6-dideoxyhexose 3-C-methyltransferase
MYRRIERCRICGNEDLVPILDLGTQCLTGCFPRETTEKVSAMPLELVKCRRERDPEKCGLVQLRHTFQLDIMYGESYGYRSSLNSSMVSNLREIARDVVARVNPVKGDLIIDIGSNDSTLLQAYPRVGLGLLGIDPTGKKFAGYYPDHIQLVPDFFSEKSVRGAVGDRKARVVTSIAMFYDLEDPMEFMRQVGNVLADDGIWMMEQSYMPTMLEKNSYDTVCHEHLEYYSLAQIRWMAIRVGLQVLDVSFNDVNGGSFRVTLARQNSAIQAKDDLVKAVLDKETEFDDLAPYESFGRRTRQHRQKMREFVDGINEAGQTVFGYGASTKGNVLLQYCGLTSREIPYIAEVNEDKLGCFTPGSLIPIISEKKAKELHPDYFLVLPWHFKDNIVSRESAYLASKGRLIFPLPSIEVV